MANESKKPKIGDTIATYKILSPLGSGGMGDVFLCEDAALGRNVAVKIMHSFDPSETEVVERFILEGKSLAKLTHPNIVSVYGLGEDNGYLYIAMEHVPGRSLFQLSRERRLTFREMKNIFLDIAAGCDHANSHGIVHRDIKPANILVDSFGRAKIIDFGIAKVVGGNRVGTEGVKTKTGAVIGTLNYIAPEIFRGISPSPASDIYALGLVFFEMLTGRTPFKGDSQFATMELIRAGHVDVSERLQMILPDELWKILYQMIDRDPAKRPATATEAAKRIERIESPEFPSYFNSDLVSVQIENVDELHDILEKDAIDPEEWQFILALAVRAQAAKRTNPNGFVANAPDEGEATKLIENTGFRVDPIVLKEAMSEYQRDMNMILTTRRASQLEALVPPPPSPVTAETIPAAVGGAPTGVPSGMNANSVASGVTSGAITPPQKSSWGMWLAVPVVAGVLGGGFWYYKKSEELTQQRSVAAVAVQPRRLGQRIDSPSDGGKAAPKTTAAVAPVPAAGGGFAMVIEPTGDAWTPIPYKAPAAGMVEVWRWRVRSEKGNRVLIERREFGAMEDGLEKVKIELSREGQEQAVLASGWEWYTPGYPFLPRKTLRSPFFGSVGGDIVGQPNAVFPLRKGKEVQFQLGFQQTEAASALMGVADQQRVQYRSSCLIRDKVKIGAGAAQIETVKIDCTSKSDQRELTDVIYWSEEKAQIVRHDRRFSQSVDGIMVDTMFSGEIVSRKPASVR
ncbi:MAG: protein kinase [Bdellovibrionales bacterium]|nr:protein kinase [Bdellovibrionales bacterium]